MSSLDDIHEEAMDEIIDCLKSLSNATVETPVIIREDEDVREVSITVKFLDAVKDDLIESFIYLFLDIDDGAFIVANNKQYEIEEMSVWLSLFYNKETPEDYDELIKDNARLKKEIAILRGAEPVEIITDGW